MLLLIKFNEFNQAPNVAHILRVMNQGPGRIGYENYSHMYRMVTATQFLYLGHLSTRESSLGLGFGENLYCDLFWTKF